jgi:hypothetical protein
MTQGQSKSFWKSKTLWVNGVVLILAVTAPGLNEEARSAVFGLAASNILLRIKTNQKLGI